MIRESCCNGYFLFTIVNSFISLFLLECSPSIVEREEIKKPKLNFKSFWFKILQLQIERLRARALSLSHQYTNNDGTVTCILFKFLFQTVCWIEHNFHYLVDKERSIYIHRWTEMELSPIAMLFMNRLPSQGFK